MRDANVVLDAPAYNIALMTFINLEKHDEVDKLRLEACASWTSNWL